nr:protein kinase superfamily protein [Tanacetum cinerariifolium]
AGEFTVDAVLEKQLALKGCPKMILDTGAPPHDVIDVMARTIVTTVRAHKNKTTSSEKEPPSSEPAARDIKATAKRPLLPLKEIPGELGINPSLLEQDPSLSSSQKRKALELEPGVRIASLECNRSLPEGVQFVNNKVIETPRHGIFFIDAFGGKAFQRISDIHKVEVESLLGYMVMAGNISTP